MNTTIRINALKTRDRSIPATNSATPHQKLHWSAEHTRRRLARSFSKLCTLATLGVPSPWAEVEITEE